MGKPAVDNKHLLKRVDVNEVLDTIRTNQALLRTAIDQLMESQK